MTEPTPQKPGLKRIGELLLEAQILSDADLAKGLEYGKKTGMALGRVLTMLRLVSETDLRAGLHVQSLMKFEGMPPPLAVRALRYMKDNSCHIEWACKQIGWQSQKFKDDMPPRLRELKEKYADVEQRLGTDHPEIADILLQLAEFYESEDMWAHAEANCQMAIDKLERALGHGNPRVANAISKLGRMLFLQNRHDEAQTQYQKAFDIKYNTLGEDDLEVARALHDLGQVHEALQKFGEAERFYLRSLSIRDKVQDIEEPEMLEAVRRLAFVCSRRGRAPDQVLIGQLLAESGIVSEEKIPEALAHSRKNNLPLARAFIALQLLDEDSLRPVLHAQLLVKSNLLPAPLAVRCLRLCARRKIHIDEAMKEVGWTLKEQRTHNVAELLSTSDALLEAEGQLPSDSPEIANLCLKLAELYETYERYAEAEPLFRRALSIVEKQSEHDAQLLVILEKIGLMSVKQGKFEQAEGIFKRVLQVRIQKLGPQHIDVGNTCMHLGQMYVQKGDHINAIKCLTRALPIAEKQYGAEHAYVGDVADQLAVCYYETGQYDKAEPLFWRAFKIKRVSQDTQSSEITSLLTKLADLYNKQGQYNMADSVLSMFKENKSVVL
ncbi:MAG TPA: tetratricopeptide repeat protein [Candidatus Obscuribacterales bacterium]